MGKNSRIEWCDHTWNPWYGCHKVSAGCKHCYMYRDMSRTPFDPNVVTRAKSATFRAPLKWKDPAIVFTCSWSDFFIEEADPWRAEALEIMVKTPHTYLVLTKRIERVLKWLDNACWPVSGCPIETLPPNVWLGVSAEDQKTFNQRIPYLLEIPATMRFVSLEPLLGNIDISSIVNPGKTVHGGKPSENENHWCEWCGGLVDYTRQPAHDCYDPKLGVDWIITGGESGPYSRHAALDWFRSIRDQCQSLKIPFFHKQHGGNSKVNGSWGGRMLDGRTWDEMPRRV